MMSSQMPWESLKAETVRAIFRDLGLSKYVGKRDDMIQHLQEVEQDGCTCSFRGYNLHRNMPD